MEIVCEKNTPEGSDMDSYTVWRAFRYPIEYFGPRRQNLRISPHPSFPISGLEWGPGCENYF